MPKKLTQIINKKKHIIAIIMAGGEGSRMKRHYKTEKPLLSINGKKMIEYIIGSIINSDYFDKIMVCVSNKNPQTRVFLQQYNYKHKTNIQVIVGNGKGYSADLSDILTKFSDDDAVLLIIPADLPLLSELDISEILNKCDFNKLCNTIIIFKKKIDELGIKPSLVFQYRQNTFCYSGIAIFNLEKNYQPGKLIKERYVIVNNIGIAVNVNEKQDLDIARALMKRLKKE